MINLKKLGYQRLDFPYTDQKQDLKRWVTCGCLDCLSVYKVSDITWWLDERGFFRRTAVCPKCRVDRVVPATRGLILNKEILRSIEKLLQENLWFSDTHQT